MKLQPSRNSGTPHHPLTVFFFFKKQKKSHSGGEVGVPSFVTKWCYSNNGLYRTNLFYPTQLLQRLSLKLKKTKAAGLFIFRWKKIWHTKGNMWTYYHILSLWRFLSFRSKIKSNRNCGMKIYRNQYHKYFCMILTIFGCRISMRFTTFRGTSCKTSTPKYSKKKKWKTTLVWLF